MYIAVEGCCHGELDRIYETMQNWEKRDKIKIDLLLCCGDFQAVRDEADLHCMAVPDKYKSMETFWEYYNGKKKAPYLTIFIGGNHEASNHLQELPYGGWVAPNIYFMGYAGVVTYKGLRIGGISGIFKYHDYNKGHFEKPPYDNNSKRSVYHVRSTDVFKLKLLQKPVDIMMSHDWPNGIVHYGDIPQLLRRKPFFEEDIQRNRLGSNPAMELLQFMKPSYWFSGHLHVKFTATVPHFDPQSQNPKVPAKITNFLALDKCLPKRQFLEVVNIQTPENCESQGLSYDLEWLAVLKSTNDLLSVSRRFVYLPNYGDSNFPKYKTTPDKLDHVKSVFGSDLTIPDNFKRDIAVLYDPAKHDRRKQVQCKTSHQTTEFCSKLEINDPLMMAVAAEGGDLSLSFNSSSILCDENEEMPSTIVSSTSINEDEIDLGSESDSNDATDKTDAMASISIVSGIDATGNDNDVSGAPGDSSLASSASSDDESLNKTSSGSDTNRGISRLSLSLPAPVFGATSTPVRQQSTGTPKIISNADDFIPLTSDSSSPDVKLKPPSLAKNALLLSLRGKRLSDTDSDLSESSSGNTASAPKQFKRRNAALYTSQSEEELT